MQRTLTGAAYPHPYLCSTPPTLLQSCWVTGLTAAPGKLPEIMACTPEVPPQRGEPGVRIQPLPHRRGTRGPVHLRDKPDLPVNLRLWELKRFSVFLSVSEKSIQHSDGQQQHCQHSTGQEAGGAAEDGSQHRQDKGVQGSCRLDGLL
ncbi:guanine nucleotide-binding protein G(I)/G(S)/G(O) subunit gamma-2 isoform X2 [Lemur catta]|uniref:guanine nucleotide-binding protein G(I)/G(S)/G(O) subunit gamma-2 isoform X2 n=1 Tax=Lemur catta TaxID=9447 RepID=UPI001E26CE4F|nr:guanine nucleotide-binding protein G(I)/G(S)/G(O) subunit gamma-2 isoform X2 [Lemur catta]